MSDNMLKSSIVLRMVIVGALSIGLFVPSLLVMGLISDRETTRNSAVLEVSDKWGSSQTITGPALAIPYKKRGEPQVIGQYHLFPESLSIATSASPEIRYRGAYQVVLYTATILVSGRFTLSDVGQLNIKPEDILWDEAALAFGVNDPKGIREVSFKWNGVEYAADPGVPLNDFLKTGVTIHPKVSGQQQVHEFSVRIVLNGSGDLQFVPAGKQSVATVSSTWSNPSFVGRFLPDKRMVDGSGFTASWKVHHLNRGFPQQWVGTTQKLEPGPGEFAFGVRLIQPVDEYQKSMRSAKYAIMFISLTFLSLFLTEVLNKKTVHPIQYALIGFALVLFYCLLLALSEHLSFNVAYLCSSLGIIAMLGGYTRSVLGSTRFGAIISGVLTVLYGFLFIILQLEDYALLFGSLGLFTILSLVMYMTRKVDWFAIGRVRGSALHQESV